MKRILLVEDDPAIRESFKMIFAQPDYDLVALPDGERLLKNDFGNPDLIILDKQLTGIDGVDLCRYLKTHAASQHIPVIMISASPSAVPLGKSAGADVVLMKPYRLADLRTAVKKFTQATA